jgi:hypothetical protein
MGGWSPIPPFDPAACAARSTELRKRLPMVGLAASGKRARTGACIAAVPLMRYFSKDVSSLQGLVAMGLGYARKPLYEADPTLKYICI